MFKTVQECNMIRTGKVLRSQVSSELLLMVCLSL
jgi:hypothetical protein